MTAISHRTISTNGIEMHIAEAGSGPLVVLCHGWPESWYSWRHQLHALADAGYHVVAPDQRGYGTTDAPEEIERYSVQYLVGDIVGLVHALDEDHAVIVGHDWGALVAWACAQWRPDIFIAAAVMSVPTSERSPIAPLDRIRQWFGDRFFYQLYFQTPGVAEHEFEHDVAVTIRKILCGITGPGDRPAMFDPSNAPPDTSFMLEHITDPGDDLPAWISEEDIQYFTNEFTRTGFRGGLNWYRNIDRGWALSAAFQGKTIDQPVMFMAGDRDVVPFDDNAEAAMRQVVTDLREVVIIEDVGHWTQQEAPAEVNAALIRFLASL